MNNKEVLQNKLSTNKYGVDNLLIVIAFLVSFANAIKEALEDKKISVMEGVSLGWFLFRNLTSVVVAFGQLEDEVTDKITDEEVALILAEILKAEYLEELDVNSEMVKEAGEIIARIKNFAFKWFVNSDNEAKPNKAE